MTEPGIELHFADYGAAKVFVARTGDAKADLEDGLQSLGVLSGLLGLTGDQKVAMRARMVEAVTAPFGRQQAPSAPAQARSGGSGGGPRKGTALFCAKHPWVQVLETKAEWQEMNDEGLPDKFFCPGDQNKTEKGTHGLYRRQTVTVKGEEIPERDVDDDVPPMEQELAGLAESEDPPPPF